MPAPATIFNRSLLRHRRHRGLHRLKDHDFLLKEAASMLGERLSNASFDAALEIGARGEYVSSTFGQHSIKRSIKMDVTQHTKPHIVADEELLPFKENSFDLITSLLGLHWVNDLPGCLVQIRRCLKPNGIFLANLFGGDTLHQLRQVLTDAELHICDGAAMRVAPFADVKTLGMLLQRVGFHMPVADSSLVTVHYRNLLELLNDIRGMGEAHILSGHVIPLSRKTLLYADQLYKERFANEDEGIIAHFDIITLTGLAAPDNSN